MASTPRPSGNFTGHEIHPLEAARCARGISQAALCRAVGISKSSYSRHVLGRVFLNDSTVQRIREMLSSGNSGDLPEPAKPAYRRGRRTRAPRHSLDFLYPSGPRDKVIGMATRTEGLDLRLAHRLPISPAVLYEEWKKGVSKRKLADRYRIGECTLDHVIDQLGAVS